MQTIELSAAALALLRTRIEGGSREVNDSNLEAYRELAREASCTRSRVSLADQVLVSVDRFWVGTAI